MIQKDKTKDDRPQTIKLLQKRISELEIVDTERKKIEHDLEASETRYRRLFETAKDGILILDAKTGMIVDVNPFLIEMLGYSHEQFLGKKIWEIGFLKDVIGNRDNFLQLQREKYVRYENRPLETASGRKIDVEFVSNVYQVDSQKVIQCNIRDITDRKRMEKELAQTKESQFRTLIESLPQKIFLKDMNSVYISCNANYASDLKIKPEEIAGKTDYDFSPHSWLKNTRRTRRGSWERGKRKAVKRSTTSSEIISRVSKKRSSISFAPPSGTVPARSKGFSVFSGISPSRRRWK